MVLSSIVPDIRELQKFKMTAYNRKYFYLCLLTREKRDFKGYTPICGVQQINVTILHCTGHRGVSAEIQISGLQTGITYISVCRQDRNAISTAKTMISELSNPTELLRIIFRQTGSGKSKMAAIKLEVLIS